MPPAKRAAKTTDKDKSTSKKAASSKSAKSTASKSSKSPAARSTVKKSAAAPKTARTSSAPRPSRASAASVAAGSSAASRTRQADGTRAAAARVKRAASTDAGVMSVAEQLVKGEVSPKDVVMLTREHIQETLDDAAARGRVTRKDANELVAELVKRGRTGGEDVRTELERLLAGSRQRIGSVTKRAARSEPVDRIVRGADRARRAAGVGSSFPISGYSELNVGQVQTRLKELSKPELRKVLSYERQHANRKSVVGAIEKSL